MMHGAESVYWSSTMIDWPEALCEAITVGRNHCDMVRSTEAAETDADDIGVVLTLCTSSVGPAISATRAALAVANGPKRVPSKSPWLETGLSARAAMPNGKATHSLLLVGVAEDPKALFECSEDIRPVAVSSAGGDCCSEAVAAAGSAGGDCC